jgi:hypothetical protein
MLGKLLWTKTFAITAGKQTISIDVNNQPPGSYLLKGVTAESIIIIKE